MHSGSANVVLKNNRNLLKKRRGSRKNFVHIPGKLGKTKKEKYDHIVFDPKSIKDVKIKVLKENKKIFYKRLIAFIVLFICLIIFIAIVLQ